MRDNWKTRVVGQRIVLQPYRRAFVPRYHSWMEDEWLREMTCSERLSLEEELDLQREWQIDDQKLTFLVFERAAMDDTAYTSEPGAGPDPTSGMVGDVNVFLLGGDEADEAAAAVYGEGTIAPRRSVAEIMIMIAEPEARRKGFAQETVCLMLRYAAKTLGIRTFVAKITASNKASLALFTQKLGFKIVKKVPAFDEIHLARDAGVFVAGEEGAEGNGASSFPPLVLAAYNEEAWEWGAADDKLEE